MITQWKLIPCRLVPAFDVNQKIKLAIFFNGPFKKCKIELCFCTLVVG